MKGFLSFRLMITPLIVQMLFWIAVAISVVIAVYNFTHAQYRYGIEIIIFGPLLARVGAELILAFFQMNESLREIRKHIMQTGLTDEQGE